ncbi:hypothetical protein QBC44DRAFT_69178 [Cladorrhinum sp. PSN332]|nr:hypothetical protein QBC44DRAFT_69178 [Cladorrhinum sp. PSN332]
MLLVIIPRILLSLFFALLTLPSCSPLPTLSTIGRESCNVPPGSTHQTQHIASPSCFSDTFRKFSLEMAAPNPPNPPRYCRLCSFRPTLPENCPMGRYDRGPNADATVRRCRLSSSQRFLPFNCLARRQDCEPRPIRPEDVKPALPVLAGPRPQDGAEVIARSEAHLEAWRVICALVGNLLEQVASPEKE